MKCKIFLCLCMLVSAVLSAQKSEILKVLYAQQAAWNRGDLEGYMQGYWKNDSLVFIGSRGMTYGWKTTLQNYRKSYPDSTAMGKLSFSDIHIRMLGKKHASVAGRWKLKRHKDAPEGIFTLVFRKNKNGWKIISDHSE